MYTVIGYQNNVTAITDFEKIFDSFVGAIKYIRYLESDFGDGFIKKPNKPKLP